MKGNQTRAHDAMPGLRIQGDYKKINGYDNWDIKKIKSSNLGRMLTAVTLFKETVLFVFFLLINNNCP